MSFQYLSSLYSESCGGVLTIGVATLSIGCQCRIVWRKLGSIRIVHVESGCFRLGMLSVFGFG
jgi:hypothetical protein